MDFLAVLIHEDEIRHLSSGGWFGARFGFGIGINDWRLGNYWFFYLVREAINHQHSGQPIAGRQLSQGPIVLDAKLHGHGRHEILDVFVSDRGGVIGLVYGNDLPTDLITLARRSLFATCSC